LVKKLEAFYEHNVKTQIDNSKIKDQLKMMFVTSFVSCQIYMFCKKILLN